MNEIPTPRKVEHRQIEITPKRVERFWRKVDKSGECWIWRGYSDHPRGYGKYLKVLAHRAAFQISTGIEPGQMLVCHKCDNPRCVRPDHLFLGTNHDNLLDAHKKGRLTQWFENGSKHPNSVFTEDQVREIFIRANLGTRNLGKLAREFGTGKSTIFNIKKGRNWSHLTKTIDLSSGAPALTLAAPLAKGDK